MAFVFPQVERLNENPKGDIRLENGIANYLNLDVNNEFAYKIMYVANGPSGDFDARIDRYEIDYNSETLVYKDSTYGSQYVDLKNAVAVSPDQSNAVSGRNTIDTGRAYDPYSNTFIWRDPLALPHGGCGCGTCDDCADTNNGGTLPPSGAITWNDILFKPQCLNNPDLCNLPMWSITQADVDFWNSAWSRNGNTLSGTEVLGSLNAQDLTLIRGGTPIARVQTQGFNPAVDNTYSLGTNALRWSNVFATTITLPTFTQGSVLFAGAGGAITQDNANFFWDNTNKRLGINSNSNPAFSLDVFNQTITERLLFGGNGNLSIARYGSATAIRVNRFNGTFSSPTGILNNEVIGELGFQGLDANTINLRRVFNIDIRAAQNITSSGAGSYGFFEKTRTGQINANRFIYFDPTNNVLVDPLAIGISAGAALNAAFGIISSASISGNIFLAQNSSLSAAYTMQNNLLHRFNPVIAAAIATNTFVFSQQTGGVGNVAEFISTNDMLLRNTTTSGTANTQHVFKNTGDAANTWLIGRINNGDFRINQWTGSEVGVGSLLEALNFDTAARAGFNTTTINSSAQVQIDSTTRGFLPPRMTEAQKNAIATPAAGLLIFQTDGVVGFYGYDGTNWIQL